MRESAHELDRGGGVVDVIERPQELGWRGCASRTSPWRPPASSNPSSFAQLSRLLACEVSADYSKQLFVGDFAVHVSLDGFLHFIESHLACVLRIDDILRVTHVLLVAVRCSVGACECAGSRRVAAIADLLLRLLCRLRLLCLMW